ncbi:MAG: Crp/Fnr family transcriptional regulator [Bacteroidales bacterium]|jgi:CRP/FNR family transcriptional regulator|nr:Crp/Fnr family transcriptional regulator [Bacteroidales bacterium]MDY0198353.1 Crp/Fnr family transcriptional regulator [Tenuifilaceae bacterium]
MNNYEKLQEIVEGHWFASALKANELEQMFQKSTVVDYRKRETVIKRGEFANHLVFLIEGYVKVEIDEGKKNFIFDIVQGKSFVGIPVVLSFEKYQFSIVTLTDARVLFVPIDAFKDALKSNSKFALSVIEHGNQNFVLPLLEKLKSASRNNIRGRLAKLLLSLANETHKSNKFNLLISRSEMAQMIGFSRENVIRMLSEFHAEGIIKISGKSLNVISIEKLEDISDHN